MNFLSCKKKFVNVINAVSATFKTSTFFQSNMKKKIIYNFASPKNYLIFCGCVKAKNDAMRYKNRNTNKEQLCFFHFFILFIVQLFLAILDKEVKYASKVHVTSDLAGVTLTQFLL